MIFFSVEAMDGTREFKSQFNKIVHQHSDTVYRVCYMYMKNKSDAEDAYQDTFLKLYTSNIDMYDDAHVHAWLITVAGNICKNLLSKSKVRAYEELKEEICGIIDSTSQQDVVLAVLQLPEMYKQTIYMYYYEGYSTAEIAEIENCKEATVRTRLARGRDLLRESLKDYF